SSGAHLTCSRGNLNVALLVHLKTTLGGNMSMVQATWRPSRTRFGEKHKSEDAARAQRKAEALRALKKLLPANEYEQWAAECQRGEREVHLERGFVMTCLSRKR